jgi:Na+/H+ antiporter NhaD/arsenite permease-like protein
VAALSLVLFCLTYLAVALGRVPGLALDRTGFALLGAVAFVASGAVSLEEAKAAIDTPTLAVLFGMMLLSAQYQLSGLYTSIGARLGRSPRRGGCCWARWRPRPGSPRCSPTTSSASP